MENRKTRKTVKIYDGFQCIRVGNASDISTVNKRCILVNMQVDFSKMQEYNERKFSIDYVHLATQRLLLAASVLIGADMGGCNQSKCRNIPLSLQ